LPSHLLFAERNRLEGRIPGKSMGNWCAGLAVVRAPSRNRCRVTVSRYSLRGLQAALQLPENLHIALRGPCVPLRTMILRRLVAAYTRNGLGPVPIPGDLTSRVSDDTPVATTHMPELTTVPDSDRRHASRRWQDHRWRKYAAYESVKPSKPQQSIHAAVAGETRLDRRASPPVTVVLQKIDAAITTALARLKPCCRAFNGTVSPRRLSSNRCCTRSSTRVSNDQRFLDRNAFAGLITSSRRRGFRAAAAKQVAFSYIIWVENQIATDL